MPEEPTATQVANNQPAADAPVAAQPQVQPPVVEPATTQEPAEDATPEAKTFDADYVRELREEAKAHRLKAKENADAAKRAADLQAKLDAIEAEKMTDEEKKAAALEAATKRASEAEAAAAREAADKQALSTDIALLRAMSKPAAGIIDPDAALKLLDRSELAFDDDGKPTTESVAKAIEGLVESYPFMKAARRASIGDAANPARDLTPRAKTDAEMRQSIYGSSQDVFDPLRAAQQGGGVVMTNSIGTQG